MGREGQGWETPFSPWRGEAPPIRQTRFLILFVEVCVKTLLEVGRQYPWQRPERCPKCQGLRVWGHGYVEAYFDEVGNACVLLKRYRCPECGVVIRVRPSGYCRRIQATVAAVRQWVLHRLEKGRWPPGSTPARQRHWLRAKAPGTHAPGHELCAEPGARFCRAVAAGRVCGVPRGLIWGVLQRSLTLPKRSLLGGSPLG